MQMDNKNKLLYQYAAFASQVIISLALSLYIGVVADKKLNWKFPLFSWLLPLLVLVVLLIKVIKDTSKK